MVDLSIVMLACLPEANLKKSHWKSHGETTQEDDLYDLSIPHMRTMVLEYESQHLPKKNPVMLVHICHMDTTLLDDKDEMSRLVSSFRFAEVEFSTHWIQRLGSFSSTKCRSVFVADNTNDLVGDIPVYLFL